MKVLDQCFGWIVVAFGAIHCVTSFRVQPLSHLTVWLSGTAVAVMIGGFLNLSRARNQDGLTRAFSLVANVLLLALAVALAWPERYHLIQHWQTSGMLVAIAVECLFAFRG